MRRPLLFLLFICMAQMGFAQKREQLRTPEQAQAMIPKNIDPLQLQRQFDPALLRDAVPVSARRTSKSRTGKIRQMRRVEGDAVDTVSYFVAAQSYYSSHVFNYSGGEVETYHIGVAVDGTKVTFTNLFNLYDPEEWSASHDYPVSGTYDAVSKTITIPTSTVFDKATIAGIIYNYYTGVLISGTVSESGELSPSDNLVFHVEGNFDRIYTDQSFGIAEYSPDGTHSYGQYNMFRSFSTNLPKNGASLVAFNKSLNFGPTYTNGTSSKSLTLVNTGSANTDFVFSVESENGEFTTSTPSGTIKGEGTYQLNIDYKSGKTGDFEGIGTLEYEAENAEPILVQMTGTTIDQPKYDAIVKKGDITFDTNIDYPFYLDTLSTGEVVASSGTKGACGASRLTATFTVPEGKLGKLSWKGKSINKNVWYYATGGYYVDDMTTPVKTFDGEDDDISDTLEFTPGQHQVRFEYSQDYYTGNADNRLYLYGLDLESEELREDSATVETPVVDLGNFILEKGQSVSGSGTVILLNKGAKNLMVSSVSSDNKEFTGDKNVASAETLKDLSIPISFTANTSGEKTAVLTILTNAGEFKVTVKANVIDKPDYSQIVKEGMEYLNFKPNEKHPFVIENGKAVNLNSRDMASGSYSSFEADFTIPAGKLGYLSWKGHTYGTLESVAGYTAGDFSMFEIIHPMTSCDVNVYGDKDASSDSILNSDSFWTDYLACQPGSHSIQFRFYKGNPDLSVENGRLEISDFRLHVIDYKEHNAELLDSVVKFDSTYVGNNRYTTATVSLHNIGSLALKLDSITGSAPFYGIDTTDSAAFNKNLDVTLWFYPSAAGEYNGSVVLHTNAGNFTVNCHGVAKEDDNILFNGDFEDGAQGWSTYDADHDGETWNLGSNLWGDEPRYCHGGHDCLGSISYSNTLGSITPDNWTISPAVTIPDDGAQLSYYVAAFHPTRYQEHYSLYITEDASGFDKIKDLTPALEETIETPAEYDENNNVGGWIHHIIDLKSYAGKTIYLVFRHHDCTGQYILRLDDVFVLKNGALTGINKNTDRSKKVISQEFYNLSGVKVEKPVKGINLVRTHYADGTVGVVKYINK